MSRPRAAVLAVLALAAVPAGCRDLLETPAEAPAGVAVSLSRSVAADAGAAFDAADRARVILAPAASVPAGAGPGELNAVLAAALLDTTLALGAEDPVRLTLELDGLALPPQGELFVGVLLLRGADPLFAGTDSVAVRPSETAHSEIGFLFPLAGWVEAAVERDTLHPGDTTRVRSGGFFATGDELPAERYFPAYESLDPGVAVLATRTAEDGPTVRVTAAAPGTARIVARALSFPGTVTDTVVVVVVPVTPPDSTFAQSRWRGQGRGTYR
ncbi:MAG TPA: hypothetical protein VFX98_12485 [Longimicrobiaceae bacterium]|nr:hypothetical protein [Longimicrobiaceae bacterium]